MEARGWTQTDLAYALGVPAAAVNQILSDKRAVSVNMARALGVALDLDAGAQTPGQAALGIKTPAPPHPPHTTRPRVRRPFPHCKP